MLSGYADYVVGSISDLYSPVMGFLEDVTHNLVPRWRPEAAQR